MRKLAFALTVLLSLTGCSSLKHVSSAEFERQWQLNDMQTFYWCEYIGEADGRAYLLRKRAPLIGRKWREEILFTEAEQLDPEFLKRLPGTKQEKAADP